MLGDVLSEIQGSRREAEFMFFQMVALLLILPAGQEQNIRNLQK